MKKHFRDFTPQEKAMTITMYVLFLLGFSMMYNQQQLATSRANFSLFSIDDFEISAPAITKSIAISPNHYIDKSVVGLHQFMNINKTPTDVFHVFSHGREGELFIDGNWKGEHELVEWFTHRLPIGVQHVNIYGCHFAKGKKGKQTIINLQKALDVSIAASDDVTGAGGDWDLEVGEAESNMKLYAYTSSLQFCTSMRYNVYVYYRADSTFTTDAAYTVNSGSPAVQTDVNQSNHNKANYFTQNKSWTPIASNLLFDNNGNIEVRLDENPSTTGSVIIADAVLFVDEIGQEYIVNSSQGIIVGPWLPRNMPTAYNGNERYISVGQSGVNYFLWILQESSTSQPDNDSDGVPDICDLDDDNDGVLDVNEGAFCTMQYFFTDTILGAKNRVGPNDLNRDFIFGNDFSFDFNFGELRNLIIETTIGDQDNAKTGTVTIAGVTESVSTAIGKFQTVIHTPTIDSSYSIKIVGNEMPLTSLLIKDSNGLVLAKFDFGELGSPVEPAYTGIAVNGSSSSLPSGTLLVPCADAMDTDGDTTPDCQDIDSDGDGCMDAKEAGYIDVNTDGEVDGTGVDTDGKVAGAVFAYMGNAAAVLDATKYQTCIVADSILSATPACPTCAVTVCPTADDIDTIGASYGSCGVPIGYTISGPDTNGCYTLTPNGSVVTTVNTCVVACDVNGNCDTSFVQIAAPLNHSVPLPMKLKDFSLQKENCDVLLQWETLLEQNVSYFNVQRKIESESYKTIARVETRANKNMGMQYSYSDKELLTQAKSYCEYRLQLVDLDGSNTYSPTRSISMSCIENINGTVLAYPNPTQGNVEVSLQGFRLGTDLELRLYNILGRVEEKQKVLIENIVDTQIELDMSLYAKGVYSLQIIDLKTLATYHLKLRRD